MFHLKLHDGKRLEGMYSHRYPLCPDSSVPTEATEMFHILKNAENPHFYGFRLHTFRTTDKVVRYGINNQFDFAEHPEMCIRDRCCIAGFVLGNYVP